MSNQALNAELTRLQTDAIVELFVLDATELDGELLHFYPGTDENRDPIVWQGVTYTAIPVEVKGFEFSTQGSPPRPSLTFGNVGGMFSALVLAFEDLIGARVVRKRTFARYLDGRPDANPTMALPDDIFFIERKVSENRFAIEFELGTSMDIDDTALPARVIHANLCAWIYRGDGCQYAGDHPVADHTDTPPGVTLNNRGAWNSATTYHVGDYVYRTTPRGVRRYAWVYAAPPAGISGEVFSPANTQHWKADECSKRIRGCELRFSAALEGLPFGGFPGTANPA